MTNQNEILERWLNEKIVELIKSYKEKVFKASGAYEKSLHVLMRENGGQIRAAYHSWFMEHGRDKNKKQDHKDIMHFTRWAGHYIFKKWMADKGITGNPYALAYHIATKGYQIKDSRKGVISDVFKETEMNKLKKILSISYIDSIKSSILNAYK
ncbi:MAG: hypothetical protein ACRC0V_07525 [Fusobacteriaceae bacterium]